MRPPRIYYSGQLKIGKKIILNKKISHYLRNVLRMKYLFKLVLFNGQNLTFNANIININRKYVTVQIYSIQKKNIESPLFLHLGQIISSNEVMQFSIQKSVELGVSVITPLLATHCNIQDNNFEWLKKKQAHWQKIALAACAQCGRNYIPEVQKPIKLETWCAQQTDCKKIYFHQYYKQQFTNIFPYKFSKFRLLIGPEGGFTNNEISMMIHHGFNNICLGPRILRTETAVIAAITILQAYFGDLIKDI
ncbi:MAG: 16S rRNA (uracil(1498)-N(3))-methyltransferase [Candidatus Dasytiphilus stammeri]